MPHSPHPRTTTHYRTPQSTTRVLSHAFSFFQHHLLLSTLLFQTVLAQVPVSDLTQYPSGLASIAVVIYYAIASDKDNLPHRRRTAGFGAETLFRDAAHGPRRNRDAKIKGITFTRRLNTRQKTAWAIRVVGDRVGDVEVGVPVLSREKVMGNVVGAFDGMATAVKDKMQGSSKLRKDGQWLVAAAAFCQIVGALEGANTVLERCKSARDDPAEMRKRYEELEEFVAGRTNAVEMPQIAGKQWMDLEKLFVRADTWEGGGRPAYISCDLFTKIIGHCVGFSYGELMAAAYYHLPRATWAGCMFVEFLEELNNTASEEEITDGVREALQASVFCKRRCDVRVWGHCFGDYMASLVSGSLIACLVSLGSTCGTWVAVTASAVADPKPVNGPSSAAWGYPVERISHLEARSRSDHGPGAVCLKSTSRWTSFRQGNEQDWCYQVVTGLISLAILVAKYPLRAALGFGPFASPQIWVTWVGIAAATLGTLISIQVPLWALTHGGKWSVMHGVFFVSAEVTTLVLRIIWFLRKNQVGNQAVRSFRMADATAGFHNIVGSAFSVHLNESTEYPVTGWLWPTTWLLAVATAGAGVPRRLLLSGQGKV
jgi:hypothetical protein